jgi:hypothetical protein
MFMSKIAVKTDPTGQKPFNCHLYYGTSFFLALEVHYLLKYLSLTAT